MARTYSTPLGHAHATYDGSTWHVAAHPSNDPSATDEACPLGGHSYAHGLSCEAWRDEAGFRGRDWRVGRLAQDALGSDQWASLREVAEAAIQTASERVAFQRRWGSLRQDRPAVAPEPTVDQRIAAMRLSDAQAAEPVLAAQAEPTHLLVYPQGDCDPVSIVSVDGSLTDDTTAVVRLPNGTLTTVLTLDLVGLDGAPDPWGDDDDDAAHFGSPAEPVAPAAPVAQDERSSQTYSVATPVSGALQVHRDGCQHLARLFASGGGVLSDGHPSPEAAQRAALQDCDRVDLAPCATTPAPEETSMSRLPSADVTNDEALLLTALYAARILPAGLVVMEADGSGTDDGWDGVQEPADLDPAFAHILMAEAPGAPDPEAIVAAMRQNGAVDRLLCRDSETFLHEQVGEEQAEDLGAPESNLCSGCLQYDLVEPDPEHVLGLHDDEAAPGCEACDALMGAFEPDDDAPEPSPDDPEPACKYALAHSTYPGYTCYECGYVAPDPEWPADYAALGILRDTFACATHGSRKEAERLAFDLLSLGIEVRVARDAVDPKRWHLAVRGGLAGCPAMWVASIRGGVDDDNVQVCDGDAAAGRQHPLSIVQ